MEEISLHILDLAQNSVSAKATCVEVGLWVEPNKDKCKIMIKDNGIGMSESTLKQVEDPFYTTRTTRKVGMGIPLFKALAEACDGELSIESTIGEGTTVTITMTLSHIDRPPMGGLADSMTTLIMCNTETEFILECEVENRSFRMDTVEIKRILDGVPINNPNVVVWLKEYIEEGLKDTYGGVQV